MRLHVRILGYFYCGVAAFIALFFLLGLLGQTLIALGLIKGKGPFPGLLTIFGMFVLLGTLVSWFLRIGIGLLNFEPSGRFLVLLMSPVLFIGLNVLLLLTKDPPRTTGIGFTVFHFTMIALGLYSLIVLLPKSGRELFQ